MDKPYVQCVLCCPDDVHAGWLYSCVFFPVASGIICQLGSSLDLESKEGRHRGIKAELILLSYGASIRSFSIVYTKTEHCETEYQSNKS